ncbi:hypothetical protein YC2023_043197 [Brassica napus]
MINCLSTTSTLTVPAHNTHWGGSGFNTEATIESDALKDLLSEGARGDGFLLALPTLDGTTERVEVSGPVVCVSVFLFHEEGRPLAAFLLPWVPETRPSEEGPSRKPVGRTGSEQAEK